MLKYKYSDGGRAEAGYKGQVGDCATRACAIATGIPYKEVYLTLQRLQKAYIKETQEMVANSKSARVHMQYRHVIKEGQSVRNGVYVEVLHRFFKSIGWTWVAKMSIGSGCTLHLGDIPESGTYVCRLSKHYVAVIDGVVLDTFQDDWDRCVYGYWCKIAKPEKKRTTARNYYITTTDKDGNILAWVDGTKYVSLHSAVVCPKAFVTRDEALKALSKIPNNEGLRVREAVTQVEWR